MTPLSIKFKKLVSHAEAPSYSREGDAAMDLTAVDMYHDRENEFVEYGTGIAVEIPKGHVGLLFPRSSVSKTSLALANSVGVIDSNYRGEVKLRFRNVADFPKEYSVGERIGQLIIVPYPTIELEEVKELTETNRGEGGFGSSGT